MRLSKLKLGLLIALVSTSSAVSAARDLLNVSYDPTRELYVEVNKEFGAYWKSRTGQDVGGVSKSMLKKSRLNFDKIEKCK